MADTHKWAEALNINAKKLEEWSVLAPDEIPLIVWLLQEGHVNAADYLNWAREHYAIPVVQNAYFESAFNVETARELTANGQEEWRPWYFPVEQWDGLTLVTCVEPPNHPPADNIRFVLADPNTLHGVWSQMANSFSETSMEEMPPLPPEPEAPVGMGESTGTKIFKLNLDLSSDDLFKAGEPDPSNVPAPPTIEPTAAEASADQPLVLNIPKVDIPAIPDEAGASAEPPTMPPKAPAAKAMPVVPPPPAAAPTAAPPAAVGTMASVENQTEYVLKAFATLTATYDHVFIMKCTNGIARLYKWDANLNPKNGGKNVQVDLAFPTFLRIVSKTGMPYHGYLVDSPAHLDFFSELSIAKIPGCVTAVPIKHGQDMVGVLVGVGDESLQKLDVLPKVEAAAVELAKTIAPALADAA